MSSNLNAASQGVPAYLASKGYTIIPVNPHAVKIIDRVVYRSRFLALMDRRLRPANIHAGG